MKTSESENPVTSNVWRLFRILARGGFHSGEAMAKELGVRRAAVWKLKQSLEDMGVRVHAVRGRGYRLDPPPQLLDERRLRQMGARFRDWDLRLHMALDSTSAELWRCLDRGEIRSGTVCLAEYQTAGRGRRGKMWYSPPGRNLYVSLYWRFEMDPAVLHGLSPALGVAVAEALESLGVEGVGLKWPNDIQVRGRKLAGLLVDLRSRRAGPVDAVVGLGVNHRMEEKADIDQPWTDLHQCTASDTPGRNRAAASLLEALTRAIRCYDPDVFAAVRPVWERFDVLMGQPVEIHGPARVFQGIARGLADDGSLRVEVDGRVRCFHSGEVSVRRRE